MKGITFGLTSGTITTLGLMVGLSAGTNSRLAVIGGVLTIAIADAFSDALGIHISEESNNEQTSRHVWESTIATFVAKLIFASTFIVPVILFPLSVAIPVSISWGGIMLAYMSYLIAKLNGKKPWQTVVEHLTIATVVILAAYFVGKVIETKFGSYR
jgi:VIT1/CCC1 family predicted Fe2+/Mn2+ transporter